MKQVTGFIIIALLFISCSNEVKEKKPFQFVIADPGHFHSALVQKSMYPEVDSIVHVYAPAGKDVDLYLEKIGAYNARTENPTHWNEVVYTGDDFFKKMIDEKKGNVLVLAGNNRKKTDYISDAVNAGMNVYADKPMAIDPQAFEKLKTAFETARQNKVLLYDIMTERFEITSILQKELSQITSVFGQLQKGSAENPAITKESVHHFYKEVSGKPLQRPAWFYDVTQEGEGIVDVTTHLVDLVQWEAFPEQIIDYTKDIEMGLCSAGSTTLTNEQFTGSTNEAVFPEYLKKYIDSSGLLQVRSNGEINYSIRGVHARVKVIWNYKAEEGGGDTHYSIMRGTNCDLVIRQGKEQQFVPELYIEVKEKPSKEFSSELLRQFSELEKKYQGISLEPSQNGWKVVIPKSYREGHEAHFARVTENYLHYLREGALPAWEVPNMITKYYITTKAFEISGGKYLQR